jgi:ketosteroid isomerase-like protein
MTEESTTPDLVELSRRFVEAGNRRDLDAMLSFFAPDAVWEAAAFGTTFEGVAAIRGFWQDWLASYEEHWAGLEEPMDLGNGVVFGVLIQKARPVGSSGEVRHRHAFVVVWVENLMVRVTNYLDTDEARAAAERLANERARADA